MLKQSIYVFLLICALNRTNAEPLQRENIALNKNAYQSSTFNNGYDWLADYAVDGKTNYSETCKCCSLTTGGETPWLEIDLGKIYNIGKIDVFGNPNDSEKLRQFEMFVGESPIDSNMTEDPVYTDTATKAEYRLAAGHTTIVLGNISAQYIRVTNTKTTFYQLVVCEIEVFEVCEDFHFEPDCAPCYCSGSTCNKTTGLCPSECMPGWYGPSCNIPCDDGRYGTNCSENCRCLNPASCDKSTGACTDGKCRFGWKGTYCNISQIVSQGKTVNMSSQYKDWNAERAVDGNKRRKAGNCQCCAGTDLETDPWFEIDLGMPFRIATILIFGRADVAPDKWIQSFKDLHIYASKHEQASGPSIFSIPDIKFLFNKTLSKPVITQYMTLKLKGSNRLLPICELQLLEGECDDGTFGRLCNNTCYCLGQPCNKETGECPSNKCLPGYQGDTCSEECDNGMFGTGCMENCGSCFNNTTCDNVQGNCSSCGPGYNDIQCKQPCDNGAFGVNCFSSCGYCKDNDACDHVTGYCLHGCLLGYAEPFCNDTCKFGLYGGNCAEECGHCANNQTCNVKNGYCGDVGCVDGYIPPFCVADAEEQRGDNFAAGSLAAIISCILFMILAVLVVGIVLYRKRRYKETQSTESREVDKEMNAGVNETRDIVVSESKAVQKNEEVSKDDPEYYAYAPRPEDIKIHQIWDYIHKGMENDCKIFTDEFESLKKGLQYECTVALEAKNRQKNRYKEIYAYDANRVVLAPLGDDEPEDDYINASFIDGYEKVGKFIASQGPTKEMVDDFWRMIWQQQCSIIVMLTNIYELGVQKCLQYWPIDEEPIAFGDFTVKLLKEEKETDYVLRVLEINDQISSEIREIKQYHFTSWPDKTIPDTAWSLVSFWRVVRDGSETVTSAIVIHCSAGIGRTGTFIALDNLYHQATREGSIRPLQMLETLRKQRVNMVQTKEQYVYMHEAVAEALLFGTHSIKSEQFEDVYMYLTEKSKDETKTNMEIQFDLIEMSLQDTQSTEDIPDVYQNATKRPNDSVSQENNHIEKVCETELVYSNVRESALSVSDTQQTNDETDKTFSRYLRDYNGEPSFLVLPRPTSVEILKDVLDTLITTHVQTIIQLKDDSNSTNELIYNSKVEAIELTLVKGKETEHWTQNKLSLTYTEEQSRTTVLRNVRQFEYSGWKSEDYTPERAKDFFDLLQEIQIWQPIVSKDSPIVLIDSAGKSHGLLCVLLRECMRVRTEDAINIVEAVKKIREQESAFISNFDQYKFCYDVIRNAVQQSDLYENL